MKMKFSVTAKLEETQRNSGKQRLLVLTFYLIDCRQVFTGLPNCSSSCFPAPPPQTPCLSCQGVVARLGACLALRLLARVRVAGERACCKMFDCVCCIHQRDVACKQLQGGTEGRTDSMLMISGTCVTCANLIRTKIVGVGVGVSVSVAVAVSEPTKCGCCIC